MDPFAALADPVRRDLLRTLSGGGARVVDLAAGRPISRPAVSRHLRVLTDAGLVVADVLGRERHYRVRAQGLDAVASFLAELAPGAGRPPVTRSAVDALDALDLEVRRVGRDRRARAASPSRSTERRTVPATQTPHPPTGETA